MRDELQAFTKRRPREGPLLRAHPRCFKICAFETRFSRRNSSAIRRIDGLASAIIGMRLSASWNNCRQAGEVAPGVRLARSGSDTLE